MSKQTEIREQVTAKIVEALKQGVAPWRRPWRHDFTNTGAAANAASGRSYRGVNALLLGLAGYSSRWWATFAQIQALGGRVKKGERAMRVVYWRQVEKTKVNEAGVEEVETFPLLRVYCVFNVEQCEGDGIEKYLAQPRTTAAFSDFEPAEQVIAATGAIIRHGGNRAFYQPNGDFIQLPPKDAFESQVAYYGTLAHEACHWTGNESRLNRLKKNARFGNAAYSFEELVAEIGGCFLLAGIGVPQSDDLSNHNAYLGHWLSILQADPTAIFSAASQASAAVDYILGFNRQGSEAGCECEAAVAGVGE